MKIIEPSATIIEDELSQLSIYQRIDKCTSVCYQRPPKPTEEEAQAFCKKLIDRKHFAALEMAVVHLVVENCFYDEWENFNAKYLSVTSLPGYNSNSLLVTGSIRTFMELLQDGPDFYNDILEGLCTFLNSKYILIFPNSEIYTKSNCSVRIATRLEIPWKHKHVAVRFIINRAVSHELVRHRPASYLQESQRYCRYEDDVIFIRPEWYDLIDSDKEKASRCWEDHMVNCSAMYKRLLHCKLSPQQARSVLPNSTKTEVICYASLPQWKHMFNLRCDKAADPEMRRVMIPLREEFKEKYPAMWKN